MPSSSAARETGAAAGDDVPAGEGLHVWTPHVGVVRSGAGTPVRDPGSGGSASARAAEPGPRRAAGRARRRSGRCTPTGSKRCAGGAGQRALQGLGRRRRTGHPQRHRRAVGPAGARVGEEQRRRLPCGPSRTAGGGAGPSLAAAEAGGPAAAGWPRSRRAGPGRPARGPARRPRGERGEVRRRAAQQPALRQRHAEPREGGELGRRSRCPRPAARRRSGRRTRRPSRPARTRTGSSSASVTSARSSLTSCGPQRGELLQAGVAAAGVVEGDEGAAAAQRVGLAPQRGRGRRPGCARSARRRPGAGVAGGRERLGDRRAAQQVRADVDGQEGVGAAGRAARRAPCAMASASSSAARPASAAAANHTSGAGGAREAGQRLVAGHAWPTPGPRSAGRPASGRRGRPAADGSPAGCGACAEHAWSPRHRRGTGPA